MHKWVNSIHEQFVLKKDELGEMVYSYLPKNDGGLGLEHLEPLMKIS